MLFLIAFVGAGIVALVLWKAMNTARDGMAEPPPRRQPTSAARRVSGPDDDPDFLRRLSEQVRRPEENPPT